MTEFSFGHNTHTGHVRPHNEDCYGFNSDIGLFVIADGMGGHAAGDVASQVAVEHIIESVESGQDVRSATSSAHQAVLSAAAHGRGHPDMGTTAVAVQLQEDRYQIAWIGDSRAYGWNGRLLVRLSHDHSMVQELVDNGMLSDSEAAHYPFSNLLTRTIGVDRGQQVAADVIEGTLEAGQQILLCTDGLTNEMEDEDIKVILAAGGTPQNVVDHLIDLALANGGGDNVTALLIGKAS